MTTSFTGWKKRIAVGTRLLCVENTKRPILNGRVRIVERAQGNAMAWRQEEEVPGLIPAGAIRPSELFWTYYPKAALVSVLDEDTVRMPLQWDGNGPLVPPGAVVHAVTLRILEPA